MKSLARHSKGSRRSKGAVAIEYALNTVIMAIVGGLLFVIYQLFIYGLFAPVNLADQNGAMRRDNGMGMKEVFYQPLP